MTQNLTKWLNGISEMQLGKLYESKCPDCGNIDRLTERETKESIHCQRCYHHYGYKEDV